MASKQANWPYVINLGNSIIGVSVLAMPFCFRTCGLLLGALLLLVSALLTKTSCNLLIKAATTSRKRTYEFLALYSFGPPGKLVVEVSIIGMLLGTCVAFYVIIGDLGPVIVSKVLGVENSSALRTSLMVFLSLFVALPLGMLRQVESLSNLSAISIGFYTVFVAEMFSAAFPNLWSGVWVAKVEYWNPEGVFRCLPIFSLAFSCQTTLFVMYDALPEPSLKRMSTITKGAITMCAVTYLTVGFFGYVAFCDDEISGDVLLNFRPTIFSEAIKFGFVLSVAVSFPLVIFPCRASIYTLFFAKESGKHETFGGSTTIPVFYSKVITLGIVLSTLVVGILVPNIEFILAITGATMGSMICYIFPAVMFIHIMSMTKTNSKSTAQLVLFLGVTILLASTYVTLNAQDRVLAEKDSVVKIAQPGLAGGDEAIPNLDDSDGMAHIDDPGDLREDGDDVIKKVEESDQEKEEEVEVQDGQEDKRQEPPNPHAPLEDDDGESVQVEKKEKAESKPKEDEKEVKVADDEEENLHADKKEDEEKHKKEDEEKRKEEQKEQEEMEKEKEEDQEEGAKKEEDDHYNSKKKDKKREKEKEVGAGDDDKPEQKAATKSSKEEDKEEAKAILAELKDQQKEQKKLIEEQKQIIEDLKEHQKQAHAAEKAQESLQEEKQAGDLQQQQVPVQQPDQQQVPDRQQKPDSVKQQGPVVPEQQQPPAQKEPVQNQIQPEKSKDDPNVGILHDIIGHQDSDKAQKMEDGGLIVQQMIDEGKSHAQDVNPAQQGAGQDQPLLDQGQGQQLLDNNPQLPVQDKPIGQSHQEGNQGQEAGSHNNPGERQDAVQEQDAIVDKEQLVRNQQQQNEKSHNSRQS